MNWPARYKLIALARRSVGLTEEGDWRATLSRETGVESVKQLDDAGFDRLMEFFRSLGFVSDKRRAGYDRTDRGNMASAGQIAKIRELWIASTEGFGSDAGLRTFINNKTGASDLRFVDRRGAHILITALTSWKQRVEKKATQGSDNAG